MNIHQGPRWYTRIADGRRDNPMYTDYQAVIEWVEYGQFRTELIQVAINDNPDIPYDEQLVEMGCVTKENPILDNVEPGNPKRKDANYAGRMNDRHFRELCVRYGNQILAMCQRRYADILPIIHTRPEFIEQHMECHPSDANTIGTCLQRMQFNKSLARRVIFGYMQQDGVHRSGFQGVGEFHGESYAEMLEDLVTQLPDLPEPGINGPRTLDDDRSYYYDVSCKLIEANQMGPDPLAQLRYIEQSAARDQLVPQETPADGRIYYYSDGTDPGQVIFTNLEEDDDIDPYVDGFGEEQTEIIDDGIKTFPMFDGTESLDTEYINRIRAADVDEIWAIQQDFFRQRNQYTGRTYPPRNKWMTPSQKRFAWSFINDRKVQLLESAVDAATEQTKEIIALFTQLKPKQRKALVLCYINGREFDIRGTKIKFSQRPSSSDQFLLWAEIKRIAA